MAESWESFITGLDSAKTAEIVKYINSLKEELKKLGAAGGDAGKIIRETLSKAFSESGNDINKVAGYFKDNFKGAIVEAEEKLKGLSEGFKALSAIFNDVKDVWHILSKDIREGMDGANNETMQLAGSFVLLTAAVNGLNGEQAFGELGLRIGNTTKKFTEMAAAVEKITGSDLGFGKIATGLLTAAEYSKQFENQVLETAAKAGNLGNIINFDEKNADAISKQLDEATNKIQQAAKKSALAMGMSYDQSLKQTMDLLKVLPEELDKSYTGVGNKLSSNPIQAMELLQVVAKGTGQSFESVTALAGDMFAKWGSGAKDAAERMSLISRVSTELRIPFENLKNSVQSIDDGFKMWGTSAEGTLGILKQVSSVLKDQGIGYAAQIELVNNLASSVRGLGLEKKAYIGMEAGLGGTAIGSGLQLEQMMQKGQWDKISGMVQQSLGNIGGVGRVLSLEEATKNPEQETAFVAQREALSKIFGIGGDIGQQNRLMDVMSKISLGTDKTIDGGKALEQVVTAGKNIQEKQFNVLENIYTEVVSLTSIAASREAYQKSQQWVGSALGGQIDVGARDARIANASRDASSNVTSIGRIGAVLGGIIKSTDELKLIGDNLKRGYDDLAQTAGGISSRIRTKRETDEREEQRINEYLRKNNASPPAKITAYAQEQRPMSLEEGMLKAINMPNINSKESELDLSAFRRQHRPSVTTLAPIVQPRLPITPAMVAAQTKNQQEEQPLHVQPLKIEIVTIDKDGKRDSTKTNLDIAKAVASQTKTVSIHTPR